MYVKPVFRKLPSDVEVIEGQTVRLDSVVTGRPNPEITWFRNDAPVYDDLLHKIVVNEDGVSSLILRQTSLKDAGRYRCVAKNQGGEDSFDVSVRVKGEYFIVLMVL